MRFQNLIVMIFVVLFMASVVGPVLVDSYSSPAAAASAAFGVDVAPDEARYAGVDVAPKMGGLCCWNPWQVYRGLACYEKEDGSIGQLLRWGPDRKDKYQDLMDGEMIESPALVGCAIGS